MSELKHIKAIYTAEFAKREVVTLQLSDGREVTVSVSPTGKRISVYVDGELIKGEQK